jgi:hypothetical protein
MFVYYTDNKLIMLPIYRKNKLNNKTPLVILLKEHDMMACFIMCRKIEIVQFASRTRQLFVRLLALVKWANSASKVDKCAVSIWVQSVFPYFQYRYKTMYVLPLY